MANRTGDFTKEIIIERSGNLQIHKEKKQQLHKTPVNYQMRTIN
jgi:hypothetical protein